MAEPFDAKAKVQTEQLSEDEILEVAAHGKK
jgi:hypothetical protein